jgi:hypothetical protein
VSIQVTESNLRETLEKTLSSLEVKPLVDEAMATHRKRHGEKANNPDNIGAIFFTELIPKTLKTAQLTTEVQSALRKCVDAGFKPQELESVVMSSFFASKALPNIFHELAQQFGMSKKEADDLIVQTREVMKETLKPITVGN